MIKGLYVAGTGMNTNITRMDVISNNLANANTTGYKKDTVSIESFHNRLFYRQNGSNLPFQPGAFNVEHQVQGREHHLKTDRGFFRVQTPQGVHYDKGLRMIVDDDGYLRTAYKNFGGSIDPMKGHLVLGERGPIFVGDADLEVNDEGEVLLNGQVEDRLVLHAMPHAIGTMSAGVKSHRIQTDFSSGQLERTDRPYDLAIQGDAFFNIETEHGVFYSKNGSFTINGQSQLVTLEGNIVLGEEGPIIIESETFSVNSFGEVIQNGEITDRLKISEFSNLGDLEKVGGTFYRTRQNMSGEEVAFTGEIVQGFVETSNADSISEMVRMIELNRNYESSQKVITTIDELIGKAVNEIGRL